MGAHVESAEAARGSTLSHHLSVSTSFLSGKMSPRFEISSFSQLVALYSFPSLEMTHCLLSSLDWCETTSPLWALFVWLLSFSLYWSPPPIIRHRPFFPSLDGTRPSITDSFSLTENEESNIFSFGTWRPCYLKDSPSVLASGLWVMGEVWLFPTQAGWTAWRKKTFKALSLYISCLMLTLKGAGQRMQRTLAAT